MLTGHRDIKKLVRVGLASCGIAAGARQVYETLQKRLAGHPDIVLKPTGCAGLCYAEALVEVAADGKSVFYRNVTPAKAERIFAQDLLGGETVKDLAIPAAEIESLLAKQRRIVLHNCGVIDPESLDDYLAQDGYKALQKVLAGITPEEVIDIVTRAGLRGRGGAGFATGTKWRLARRSPEPVKYLVCNADEGDPGAFMDRSVLESDPHSVIEGMLIAGYAIGATEGFIYVRAEYPMAIKRLEIALAQAREKGFMGESILGTEYGFDISLRQGAGAFVCGEETALMLSIEGKRGMPRIRPPFPAQSGLWGKPTNINNVETFANVPWILRHGAEAFAGLGTPGSKGTKVFALAGKVARSGLVEVPMGTTLREIVFDIGGGTSSGLAFKAVQIGGPSGGVIPASLADIPVDYESINQTGAIMGSGGLIVMDESACMVDVARFFLNFTHEESCGKCTFCRIGSLRLLETLQRISRGQGKPADPAYLEELAQGIKKGSLCGLGQTAPNPVLTTLKYFTDEYAAHINDKKCPAKKCQALITYRIDPAKCRGCGLCAKYCAAGAIRGTLKAVHVIDEAKCVRCGLCLRNCKLKAISVS